MAESLLIMGFSGHGKSHSLIDVDEDSTYYINVANKSLPFPGSKAKFNNEKKNTEHIIDPEIIKQRIEQISENPNAQRIKVIVVDDMQYIMADEFIQKALVKGYDKFTIMAKHTYDLMSPTFLASLREDLILVFMTHAEEVSDGRIKVKTIGKMLDEKITIEGLFTHVLMTHVDITSGGERNYYFVTQTNGRTPAKMPSGMFDDVMIPNDLNFVLTKIKEYHES